MAIGTAYKAVNMSAPGALFDLDHVGTHSSTNLTLFGMLGEQETFKGTGVGYGDDGEGGITVTGGTVTSVEYYKNGVEQWQITGLNHSAVTTYQLWEADNNPGLLAFAFNGNDKLTGSSSPDTINSYAGADVLNGKGGNDKLTGGAGADKFVFDMAAGTGNTDTIKDFSHAQADKIVLDNDIFTQVGVAGALKAGVFVAAANIGAASGGTGVHAEDRVLYDTDSGNLYYDSNGSATGGRVLIATLTDHPVLVAGDFTVAE